MTGTRFGFASRLRPRALARFAALAASAFAAYASIGAFNLGPVSFPTHAALVAATPSFGQASIAQAGYYAAGDGGFAEYDWNAASTATADGVFVILPSGQSAGTAGRYMLRVPAEGVHPEAAGAYCDNPIGATTGHDDAAALNALSGYIQNSAQGVGAIVQNQKKTTGCYVHGADFTLYRGVTLAGSGMPLTANGGNPTAIVPFIMLDAAHKLICSASSQIRDLAVMRAGLAAKPTTFEQNSTYVHTTIQDSSIGIYNNSSDCTVKDVMVVGFNKGLYSTGGARLVVDTLYLDDANGLEVTANADTSFIRNVRGYPFWSFSLNGHLGAYAATPGGSMSGYVTGNVLTAPGGTCATQPTFTATASGGVISALAVNDTGDCTASPQSWGATGASLGTGSSGGAGGTAGAQVVTVTAPGCTTAPTLNVTIAAGAITAVNSVANAGVCPVTGQPSPLSSVTGAGLSGAKLNVTMGKNPIALTGGAGSGATATLSTEDAGYRTGVAFNFHDRADGLKADGLEAEEYQTQAYLSNVWNAEFDYLGGEGGYANADHQTTGVWTANCVSDVVLKRPNSDANTLSLNLQHLSAANGGSCGGASNSGASLTIVGGHIGFNPGVTQAAIQTGAYSSGTITNVILGWGGAGLRWPAAVQIGASSGAWLIDDIQFDFSAPAYFHDWISVDPTAVPPSSNQFASTMQGSLLINGDFWLDQPNEFAASSVNNATRVDRWRFSAGGTGAAVASQGQNNAGPPGYPTSLKLTNGSAVTPATTTDALLWQNVENPALIGLNWSTALAEPALLEFCATSSLSGQQTFVITSPGFGITYLVPYTPTAAWGCYQTVVPGPVIGNFPSTLLGTGSGNSFAVNFDLGSGPGRQSANAYTWQSGGYTEITGATQLAHNASATLTLGAVHLRPGPFQRPYAARPYGAELALAQRYFMKSFPPGTAVGQNKGAAGATTMLTPFTSGAIGAQVMFPAPMAASPTVTLYSTSAATANCYDSTRSVDVGAGSAVNTAASGFFAECALSSGSPASGDQIQVHWSADVGF